MDDVRAGADAPVDEPLSTTGVKTKKDYRRIGWASFIGTLIEGYDLALYATAAALVFPEIFFPALGSVAGTVASFATFAVAFVARPIGSVIFGHFGDRMGRKKSLILTLLMMGFSTVAIGLVPPASVLGVIAPVILIVCRVLQGAAQGGEWASAVLFATEHAPRERRGVFGMIPNLGLAASLPLSSGTFLAIALFMSDDAFVSWGWRIPFVSSIVLVAIGLWLRLAVEETPVFTAGAAQREAATTIPFVEAFKRQPMTIFLASGVTLATFVLVYTSNTYLAGYAAQTLEMTRPSVLVATTLGGFAYCVGTALSGFYSDAVGRLRALLMAQGAAVVWSLLLFWVVGGDSLLTLSVAMVISFLIAGLAYGPIAAFLAELFRTEYRATASGFAYNISGVVGGGIVPLLAPVIVSNSSTTVLGIFLAGCCALALIATVILGDTRDRDLMGE